MSRPSSVYSSNSVESGETERPSYRPVFGRDYLSGSQDDEDEAYLSAIEVDEIHALVCGELVRVHNKLIFLFHALDAFPAFVHSLPYQPPLFFAYWRSRWTSVCVSIVVLAEYRSKIERYAAGCAPELRAVIERGFASLWLNMDFTHDAVIDFEQEVAAVDRRYQ